MNEARSDLAVAPAERAVEAAVIVIENGGPTPLAERTLRDVLDGCGGGDVSVTWHLDVVAAHGVTNGRPWSIFRPVGPIGTNLLRASEAARLGERLSSGKVPPAEIPGELARIRSLGRPYGGAATILAAGCAGAFFSRIPGGDVPAMAIAFVAGGTGQVIRLRLLGKQPPMMISMVCGFFSACIAGVAVRLGLTGTGPEVLIASVIYLVPGLPLINGFLDMMTPGYLLVGMERIANAMLLFLVLAIAIAFAMSFVTGTA